MLPHQPNFFTNRSQVTPPSDLGALRQPNGTPFVDFREMFRKNVLFSILWCVIFCWGSGRVVVVGSEGRKLVPGGTTNPHYRSGITFFFWRSKKRSCFITGIPEIKEYACSGSRPDSHFLNNKLTRVEGHSSTREYICKDTCPVCYY